MKDDPVQFGKLVERTIELGGGARQARPQVFVGRDRAALHEPSNERVVKTARPRRGLRHGVTGGRYGAKASRRIRSALRFSRR